MPYMIGKLNNSLLSAQNQWKSMCQLTNDFDFKPSESTTLDMLTFKTNVAESTKQVVTEAMEAIADKVSIDKIFWRNCPEMFRHLHFTLCQNGINIYLRENCC
ncbi:MAG: hypothetical protein ACI9VI_002300 [Candidatus Azotimanducaceae bacterium]|jgi:hypothetical protein